MCAFLLGSFAVYFRGVGFGALKAWLFPAGRVGQAAPRACVRRSADTAAAMQAGALVPPPPPVPRGGRNRKRKDPDVVDERTARLQKRMVKNRESAARSRARKQQYTTELESQARPS